MGVPNRDEGMSLLGNNHDYGGRRRGEEQHVEEHRGDVEIISRPPRSGGGRDGLVGKEISPRNECSNSYFCAGLCDLFLGDDGGKPLGASLCSRDRFVSSSFLRESVSFSFLQTSVA